MRTRTAIAIMLLAIGGCAKAPPVPTDSFYRLPPPRAGQTLGAPWTRGVILVRQLRADGVHSDRAILYTDNPQGLPLRRYSYHLWVDPPPRMVQQQLAAYLRDVGAAPLVVTSLEGRPDLVVSGRISRFEREDRKDRVMTHVVLELELEDGHGRPLLLREYRADLPAADSGVTATVNAIDAGLDTIYAKFVDDAAAALRKAAGAQ